MMKSSRKKEEKKKATLGRALALANALGLATFPLFAPIADAAMPRKGGGGSLRPYVEGEVLVKMKDSMPSNDAAAVLSRHGTSRVRAVGGSRLRVSRVRVDDGMGVMQKVAELQQDPDVESAQPNYIYRTLATANDPQFGQLWGLKNSGQRVNLGTYTTANPGTSGKDMALESAWDLVTDCGTNVVAVIDTGINYDHEDLKANLWDGGATYPKHGYNFVDNTTDPIDLNGHGTHVAATIGAVGNNGVGSTGVCWKTKIMALKALDTTGSGTTADIVDAIGFAVARGAKVINMSLGQSSRDPSMEAALKTATDAGIVVVVAAGNSGANNDAAGSATYPCNFNFANLVCVAALDQSYGLARFSNYGATSVDVGAPGTNVLSAAAGTETILADTFHTGAATTTNWTTSGGGWAYGKRTLTSGGVSSVYDMLLNPSDWDLSTKMYANNLDAKIYKSFNTSAFSAAQVTFSAFVDIDASDSVAVGAKTSAGDPFVGGATLDSFNGSTNNRSVYLSYDLGACRVASCSIGFRFRSNGANSDFGMAIFDFEILGLTLNSNSYQALNGTSMASPHVAGLAAMLLAYHPKYTAADVVAAIKNAGVATPALSGKTTTGKAVNAYESLRYIAPVSGVTATAL